MPTLTICPTPGCGQLTNHGHCPTHQHADNQRRQARRERDGRNTTQWQRIRASVLERDGHQCDCGAPATTVHRIDGGQHDTQLDRYTSMCSTCHGRTDATARRGTTRS